MKDKDTKLIWESFNEATGTGDDPDIPGGYPGDEARELGDKDPWAETDGERQTREKYTPEYSLEEIKRTLADARSEGVEFTEEQLAFVLKRLATADTVQEALYGVLAALNDSLDYNLSELTGV